MNRRLNELSWSLVDLASATDESYRNVHRWVRDEVKIPAHFISRFVRAVPVDAGWLVTGEGSPEVVTESAAQRTLERIARVLGSIRLSNADDELAGSVVEGSVDGIVAVDRELHCTLWNPTMERMTGHDSAAVLGTEVFEVFPEVQQAEIVHGLRAAVLGEEGTVPEIRLHSTRSEDAVWCEAHFRPLRSGSGDVGGGFCILRDISAVAIARNSRMEAEERYAVLMEMNSKPTFLQAEGRVVEANGRFAELAGCGAPGELTGASVDELFASDPAGRPVSDAFMRIAVGEWWGPAPALLNRRNASPLLVDVVAAGVRFKGDVATQALLRTPAGGVDE